jgi:hypothetical protein
VGVDGDLLELTAGDLGAAEQGLDLLERAVEPRDEVDGLCGGAAERGGTLGQLKYAACDVSRTWHGKAHHYLSSRRSSLGRSNASYLAGWPAVVMIALTMFGLLALARTASPIFWASCRNSS